MHLGRQIQEELKRQGRSVSWLARELHTVRANVYNIFARETIDSALLHRISLLLHVNFFALLAEEIQNEWNKKE